MLKQSSFKPPLYLKNQHIQSAMNSLGPRKLRAWMLRKKLNTKNLILESDDGTRLAAELDVAEAPNGALVVLVHGWEGSSKSPYLVTTAVTFLNQGFDVLRINLRDHGDTHHLNRELFNSTRSPEVASALQGFFDTHDYSKRFLAGFSLGASFALRIAADCGEALKLSAVIAVSPPVDPANVMAALNTGLFVYERYFFRRWSASLAHKLDLYPELDYGEALAGATTIDDLNNFFVPRFTGYREVNEYFAAYALTGDRLQSLTLPAHLITAADDPIIPIEDLEKMNTPRSLQVEQYENGGHCAFVEDITGNSWVEKRMLEIFSDYLKRD